MSKFKNISQLREKMLQTIEDLENGKIQIQEAVAMAKLGDTIISTLKSEMQYSILTNQVPQIPFYGEGSGVLLDGKEIKKLP